jgi:hypothetical protein
MNEAYPKRFFDGIGLVSLLDTARGLILSKVQQYDIKLGQLVRSY